MKSELVVDAEAGRASALVSIVWVFIWIGAVGLASLIHLAFLVAWPGHFVHEDSATYLYQAQSILTGGFADEPGNRPYGVPLALVLLSKMFRPDALVFVTAQHAMSIVMTILIAPISTVVFISNARLEPARSSTRNVLPTHYTGGPIQISISGRSRRSR